MASVCHAAIVASAQSSNRWDEQGSLQEKDVMQGLFQQFRMSPDDMRGGGGRRALWEEGTAGEGRVGREGQGKPGQGKPGQSVGGLVGMRDSGK